MSATHTYILVHGAWHGSWAWARLRERLARDGADVHAVDLPSHGQDPAALGDMASDAALLQETLIGARGPAIVVTHSYGGIPATEALAGVEDVAHLVYLAAFMLNAGESLWTAIGEREPEWWRIAPDGRSVLPADPHRIFYNGCSPEDADAAAARLQPQSMSSFTQPVQSVAWRDIPSTYVICELDNAIPVFAQEAMSQRAANVRRLPTDHSPFLSRPDDLAALLREIAEG